MSAGPSTPPLGRPIGVGVVGANPDAGWARYTHLPAVQASPAFDLVAVSSRRRASAEAAAQAFGAAHAFADALALPRVLDAVERAAASGRRQGLPDGAGAPS